MPAPDYRIETVVSAPFQQVGYIAWRAGRGEAVVVDPGFDVPTLLASLRDNGLTPAAILLTHGHADHIGGVAELKAAFPDAPILIGRNEAGLLTDADANLSTGFGIPLTCPPADRLIDDGERFELAGLTFEAREIPGHSPGSMVYLCDGYDPPFAFVGDVLFAGSVGRTDLGGDAPTLLSGIRNRLFDLPDATLVLPGHGPPTTVGAEKHSNPYVGEGVRIRGLG